MPQQIDYDRVASILVEAAFFGEKPTAKRWGITDRTILNYRNRLNEDSELSDIFIRKKEAFETNWADEIPSAIRSAIRFLQTASQQADPADPESIHAVAGALKILAEVGLTKEIIDVRLSRHYRQDGAEGRSLDSLPERAS